MSNKKAKKICGIIAEYNPFHNGHKYLLDHARNELGADYIVVVMSGDHVQRGEPALIDKFARTNVALTEGADLVLELPVIFSTASAQYFARGAVSALIHTGCVNTLLFGSESGDINSLRTADFNSDNMTSPTGRHADTPSYALPNDILGREYLAALRFFKNENIAPYTLKRIGAGYNDIETKDGFASATHLRKILLGSPLEQAPLHEYMPGSQLGILEDYISENRLMSTEAYSDILQYLIFKRISDEIPFNDIFDIYDDLSDKIIKNAHSFNTFKGFIQTLKSKELAWSHISRALLHIVLDIKKSDVNMITSDFNYCPYLRPLGFKKEASELLTLIKQYSDVPFISKLADSKDLLTEAAGYFLKKDIFASELYRKKSHICPGFTSEYRMPIIIK
ncbi:MAG: nucleotidyltransferase family protein [Lachnospiraceae bacterium]|nr:nucleotidyltransferase family protein [Lachnospiraceae bacterium]